MTTTYLFANNAATTLAAPCTSEAASVTLASGSGALFPAIGADQEFSITLKDAATGEQTEIMYCTARTGDVCTVVRGQEGTTAQAWTTGDFAVNALTAGIAQLFNQGGSFGTMAAQNANAVAITGGSINVTTLEVGGVPALANPLTTKGDILVDNGTATVRLPVGTDGQVLTADSAHADGVAWETPASSTLPLTTKGDLLVDTGGALARLPVGSNGQVLSADSTQTTGLIWETNAPTLPLTTKGDLLVDTGGALARLPVGTNGQVLAADSTQTSGLVWETNTPTLPLTTKGDLLIDTGSGLARLGVGSDGQVLTARASATNGADWETQTASNGSTAAEIATIAKTLRRAINAYRPEPADDMRALAYANFNGAKTTNTGGGGIQVWNPDGGGFYANAYTRDQAMCFEYYLEYFTPAEISAIATYWLASSNLSTGEVPDHIEPNGTIHYVPAPGWGARAPVDGNFFLLQMFWCHYVSTGSASLYAANSAALKGLVETGVVYDGTTKCVSIDDTAPYVGFGFFDMATLTGSVLFPTILAVRAFQMAAEMEFSLGNITEAARLLARADEIKVGISSNLVVRSAGSGAQLAAPYYAREIAWGELATTKGVNQIDLFGSAYLVWCDIVSPDDAKRIANYLYYTIGPTLGNYYRGGLRNIDKATDFTANTQCYQATFSARTYGTYQNGGFWPTPTPWLMYAVSLVNPLEARLIFGDLFNYSLAEGANSLDEWWNATGTIGATKYLTSNVALLVAGPPEGPVQIIDEWSGLIRSVTNETLTLVLNAEFSGTILETTTKCASGTATATFEISAAALGGTANAVSSTKQVQAHITACKFAKGDDIQIAVSSNASCVDLYFSIKYIRAS